MQRATLGNDSEVVVPPEVREALGIGPGDEIVFDTEDDQVVVRKAVKSAVERLAEFSGPMWRGYADEIQRDRDEWDQ